MTTISSLAEQLATQGKENTEGFAFEVQPIPGGVEVLQIVLEDREELPLFISVAEDEILCISYLFTEGEIKSDRKDEMHHAMLSMNIPMPLSSFAKIDDRYVVYGALSVRSSLEDVVHEIEILSDNTLEAIEAMKDFLK